MTPDLWLMDEVWNDTDKSDCRDHKRDLVPDMMDSIEVSNWNGV